MTDYKFLVSIDGELQYVIIRALNYTHAVQDLRRDHHIAGYVLWESKSVIKQAEGDQNESRTD